MQEALLSHVHIASLADVTAIEVVPLSVWVSEWNFAKQLDNGCRLDPGRTAIHYIETGRSSDEPRSISYADLRASAIRVANLFRARGAGPTDVVAIVMPVVPELFTALLGGLFAARIFPINWMLDPASLRQMIASVDPVVVVALGPTPGYGIWEALLPLRQQRPKMALLSVPGPGGERTPDDLVLLAEAHEPVFSFQPFLSGADDVAAFVHSGGTTGRPKVVMITNRGLCYRRWTTDISLDHTTDETVLSDTPLFHIGGLVVRGLVPIANGMTVVIPSPLGARDKAYIEHYWRFVERFRITRLSGVPTTLATLVQRPPAGEDISSLRPIFATGSTAIPIAVQRQIEEVSGVRPLIMFGITENTGNATLDPRNGPSKPGRSGIRLPFTLLRIVELDRSGKIMRECGTDEAGLILVKGPGVVPGYLDPAHEQGAYLEGWFNTGDIGSLDAEGYLRISGRAKDIIIRGGHNIDASIIEDALLEDPGVLLAAAVARPDAYAGEVPVAYVQLKDGVHSSSEALLAAVTPRIAERPAVPKEIIIIDPMPLTSVGKPQKGLLRLDAAERAFRAALEGQSPVLSVAAMERGKATHVVVTLDSSAPDDIDAAAQLLSHFTVSFEVQAVDGASRAGGAPLLSNIA